MPETGELKFFGQQGDFAALVHAFNILPSRYIHKSWVTDTLGETVTAFLWGAPRTEKLLSAWIINDLNNEFHYDFEDRICRVALMDASSLKQLCICAGAAINTREVIKIIEGRKVSAFKKTFGEAVYQFAMKRAPLLIGQMNFPFIKAFPHIDLAQRIWATGIQSLQICLGGQPDALLNRFVRKFPKDLNWDFALSVAEEERKRVWHLLRKIILQEIGAPWDRILF